MKNHKLQILIILLLMLTSMLFAEQTIKTLHFTCIVPDAMEIQVQGLETVFAQQAGPKDSYTYTLQPKGRNILKQSFSTPSPNTITLNAEHTDQNRDNATFKNQTLAFTQEELLEASKVFENAIRRSQPVRSWHDLSYTEIDGMFAWKYSYETLTGIHTDVYIIHAGNTLFSLTMRYALEEQAKWQPIYRNFLSSQITFVDTLKAQKEESITEEKEPSLQRYPLSGSSETFLWNEKPDWKASAAYLPGQGGTTVYTIKTTNETLLSDGYYCKISAIGGLLSSQLSTQNYLLQSQRDIQQQLANNTMLKDRVIHRNEIDLQNCSYLITYTYAYPYGEESIHGAMIVKITKENILLQVEVEWFDQGEALATAIIDSIITE